MCCCKALWISNTVIKLLVHTHFTLYTIFVEKLHAYCNSAFSTTVNFKILKFARTQLIIIMFMFTFPVLGYFLIISCESTLHVCNIPTTNGVLFAPNLLENFCLQNPTDLVGGSHLSIWCKSYPTIFYHLWCYILINGLVICTILSTQFLLIICIYIDFG